MQERKKKRRMKRHDCWTLTLCLAGLLCSLTCGPFASAATQASRGGSEEPRAEAEAKPLSALAKVQKDLAQHLLEVEQAKDSEAAAEKAIEEANGQLVEATTADDADAKEKAEAALKSATEQLQQATEDRATAQQLADHAQERINLLQQEEELSGPPESKSDDSAPVPFEETFKKFSQASKSRKEADVAKQLSVTLRRHVEALQARLKQVRRESDNINQRLSMHGGMSDAAKANLRSERDALNEEIHKLSDEILERRQEMLLAEATAKTKEAEAIQEELELDQ